MSYFRTLVLLVNRCNGQYYNSYCCQYFLSRNLKRCVANKLKSDVYCRTSEKNNTDLGLRSSWCEHDIIKYLVTRLNCSLNEAELLCKDNCNFLLHNQISINDSIQILEQHGFSQTNIFENFWILFIKAEDLQLRLGLIKEWQFKDPTSGIHLLKLSIMKLKKYTSQTESDFKLLDSMNRISYFSSFVQCDERRASQLFMKYRFMMVLRVKSVKSILTMIKGQGILTEDLLSDLWVFRYSPQFISKRITRLEEIGAKDKCDVIKPWMLRCSDVILNRYFELKEENMMALGAYSNLRDLLSNELSLSAAQVEEMIAKHPPLAKMSYSKAREMIEFLRAEGFNSNMIYHVPRVLCHKQATLVSRMMELKKVAPNLINLHNLCRNKKDYDLFVKKMTA